MLIIRSAATRTLFLGEQNLCLGGPKCLGLSRKVDKPKHFVDFQKKKKGHRANLVYFCPKSLLISEKKIVILPNLFYLSPSFLAVSKKKATS